MYDTLMKHISRLAMHQSELQCRKQRMYYVDLQACTSSVLNLEVEGSDIVFRKHNFDLLFL